MATTNDPTTLDSRLKVRYPKGIAQLVPMSTVLMRKLKLRQDITPGKNVTFDVQLAHEAGFTVGSSGSLTLNPAVAQASASAIVEGYQIVLRSQVSYDLIVRAKSEDAAFASFNDRKFIPMTESFQKRCEILAMGYGRGSIGVVTGAPVDSASTLTIQFTAGSWCPALFLGSKGTTVEAFSALTGGSQHDGDLVISSVDSANRKIVVTAAADAYTNVADGDFIFYEGHRAAAPYGLVDIAKNTGTLYNISASSYDLWKSQAYDVGTSALTLAKILSASGELADRGCDQALTCLVPALCFQKLVSDEAFLVQHNGGTETAKNGFKKIVFSGVTGDIEILPYMFIKQGEFLMFPESQTYRIGASNMTSRISDKTGDMYFDMEDSTAVQMRLYAEWTVFCERPAWISLGTRSDGLALHT
jgi:hypothetical protein